MALLVVRNASPKQQNVPAYVGYKYWSQTLSYILAYIWSWTGLSYWDETWAQCYKTFYSRNLQIFVIS